MRLLDIIYDVTNIIYLSELKVPQKLLGKMEIIKAIPDEKYAIEEWEYVYEYIVQHSSGCDNVQEIKRALFYYAQYGGISATYFAI